MTRSGTPLTFPTLSRQIEEMRRHTVSAQAQASTTSTPDVGQDSTSFVDTLTQLGAALEELQVADEELRQQSEELQVAHAEGDVERRRYQELFDQAPDAYLVTDGYGKIKDANQAACRLFNLEQPTLRGKPLAVYVSPADKKAFYTLIMATRKTRVRECSEISLQPRGHSSTQGIAVEASVIVAEHNPADGLRITLRWLIRDITLRKEAEATMHTAREQMKLFASSVDAAREAERARIARELHDELGQSLTVLKMDLARIRAKLPATKELHTRLDQMEAAINGTIQSVRQIMNDLRPAMLDDLGLVATVEWQCSDFQNRTGIRCHFKSNVAEVNQTGDRATTLFRLIQEILTNVARHAGASDIRLTLKQTKRTLRLEARDNGRGISEAQIKNAHSSGLLGMRERVHLLGGIIEFVGVPDKGTTIRIQVPCEVAVATPT